MLPFLILFRNSFLLVISFAKTQLEPLASRMSHLTRSNMICNKSGSSHGGLSVLYYDCSGVYIFELTHHYTRPSYNTSSYLEFTP